MLKWRNILLLVDMVVWWETSVQAGNGFLYSTANKHGKVNPLHIEKVFEQKGGPVRLWNRPFSWKPYRLGRERIILIFPRLTPWCGLLPTCGLSSWESWFTVLCIFYRQIYLSSLFWRVWWWGRWGKEATIYSPHTRNVNVSIPLNGKAKDARTFQSVPEWKTPPVHALFQNFTDKYQQNDKISCIGKPKR
jgi:hypothetical protein